MKTIMLALSVLNLTHMCHTLSFLKFKQIVQTSVKKSVNHHKKEVLFLYFFFLSFFFLSP